MQMMILLLIVFLYSHFFFRYYLIKHLEWKKDNSDMLHNISFQNYTYTMAIKNPNNYSAVCTMLL